MLDRIHLHVELPLVDFKELSSQVPVGEKSSVIRERVVAARDIQLGRFGNTGITSNAAMPPRLVRHHCKPDAESNGYSTMTLDCFTMSGRLPAIGR